MIASIQVSKRERFRIAFFFFVMLLTLAFLYSAPRILVPMGMAYVFSNLLRPFLSAYDSKKLGKKTLAIIAILGIVFLLSYPVVTLVDTLSNEIDKVEYYIPKLEGYLRIKYAHFKMMITERLHYELNLNPVDKLIEYGQESSKAVLVYLPKLITSLLEWGLVTPLFLFFFLRDGRKLKLHFLNLVPNSLVERSYNLVHQFNKKFGDYIFAKFIEATIVGVIITTGLVAMSYPFAFLLGLLAALTNILPYIGPILGYVPALVIGLVDQNPNTTLGAMTVLYVLANVVDLSLVFPLLVSKIVNLHPVIVVISVIMGSQLAGAAGMIISIPFAALVKLVYAEVYREVYGEIGR